MNMVVILLMIGCIPLVSTQLFPGSEDFESLTENGWVKRGSTVELSSDSYNGDYSIKVSNRVAKWAGININMNVAPSTSYHFKAYIKLLNTPTGLTNSLSTVAKVTSTANVTKHNIIGSDRFMRENIWQEVGGDITTDADVSSMSIYIQVTEPGVEYLLDTVTFYKLYIVPDTWRPSTEYAINKNRKANFIITAQGRDDLSNIRIRLTQDKSEFAWGSVVNAEMIVDPDYQMYQDLFYDTFEWGVIGNKYKWRHMEWTRGKIDHETALTATNAMLKRGIKVRGHCVFWGIEKNVPIWQPDLLDSEIKGTLVDRINDVIPVTKGLLEHWDVNNENVHGNYYEERTGDVNITQWMFREINKLDPDVKLFLNDFSVVSSSNGGVSYYNQGKLLKEAGNVPIYGIGIQSHLNQHVDISVLRFRLNRIARLGLPIWITELDISDWNVTSKAEYLEDVLRLYFSHPSVEGVLLWGFWSERIWKPAAALATGPKDNIQWNAAGERLRELIKSQWRTTARRSMANGRVFIRAFRGEYTLEVLENGQPIHTQKVTLPKEGRKLQINLLNDGVTVTTIE